MFKDLRKLFWQLIIGKGVKFATQKKFDKRLSICRSNKCGVYQKPLGIESLERCGDCGCLLQTKNRIDEDFIKCPQNYWK